jgi:pimeloyl-ACP methyl ester carboxylesterase
MADIILIAGTYYGGWYWQNLVANLASSGNRVFAPTLKGLGEDSPSDSPISLSDHIQEVVDVIEENKLNDVVLVGWSYGGMVITGVPARVQAKIAHLVYLDAAVPKSGQTEFDLIPEWLRDQQLAECLDGLNQFPSAQFLNYEPRMKPHPIGTKQEPIFYDEGQFVGLAKTYVVAGRERGNGPFAEVVARISSESNWRIIELDAGHDLYRDSPTEIERILLDLVSQS